MRRRCSRIAFGKAAIGHFRSSNRQPNCLGGLAIVTGQIDKFRLETRFTAECLKPKWPIRFIVGQFDLIEDDDRGFILSRRFAEELLHGGVVIFLLRKNGDEDIRRLPNRIGSLPVDGSVAVYIGCVQNDQVRRDFLVRPPEQAVFGVAP